MQTQFSPLIKNQLQKFIIRISLSLNVNCNMLKNGYIFQLENKSSTRIIDQRFMCNLFQSFIKDFTMLLFHLKKVILLF